MKKTFLKIKTSLSITLTESQILNYKNCCYKAVGKRLFGIQTADPLQHVHEAVPGQGEGGQLQLFLKKD
jgi:hypothetical protein